MLLGLELERIGINALRPALQPQRPFGAVTAEVHQRASAVFHRVVEPVGKILRDTDLFRPLMPVLDDDLLDGAQLSGIDAVE